MKQLVNKTLYICLYETYVCVCVCELHFYFYVKSRENLYEFPEIISQIGISIHTCVVDIF